MKNCNCFCHEPALPNDIRDNIPCSVCNKEHMKKATKFPKLIGAIHLVALLGSGKYKVSKPTKAEYFANVKFWDKDDEKLRGDFQVFIKLTPPRER